MSALTRQKLDQASKLLQVLGADVWIVFVRETSAHGDPVLPLICESGFVWQAALMLFADGSRVAVVGNYDADPLAASEDWEVIPYVKSIREPLLEVLNQRCQGNRIALNYSLSDDKADGLTYGMFLQLQRYLQGTRFRTESAQSVVMGLRGQKSHEELRRIRASAAQTEAIYDRIPEFVRPGLSERDLFDHLQALIDDNRWGYGWDRSGNPIVNFGPDSMIGHGVPSAELRINEGHILHLDMGIVVDGYSSDIQRVWYVGEEVPDAVNHAFQAVSDAITAGANVLRPGVSGWVVDEAARRSIIASGYNEYAHALGHQVGRLAHDGGAILGPRWERYGDTPNLPVEQNQVYTLELGVTLPDHGYLGLEEMVVVNEDGVEWLTRRPDSMPTLQLHRP